MNNNRVTSLPVRILYSVSLLLITVVALWWGFIFLRDPQVERYISTTIAIVWGVGGVALIYYSLNNLIELLPLKPRLILQPYVFIGPAMLILTMYLIAPIFLTFWKSLLDRNSTNFVGLQNYIDVFQNQTLRTALRNNLLWIVVGAPLSVISGLIIASLADRSRYENLAKSLIFLPMAISFVGAGVIWNFMYELKDASVPQIGLFNAIWVGLGGSPQAWTAMIPQPWNSLFLIIIVVWLQTGFAMVLFSAALKGIPEDHIEAAKVDGANDWQVYFFIMIPSIQNTIITVTTTIVIFTLKIFDVVRVMTGGQFGTQVIATEFYIQNFTNRNFGYGAAIAMLLLFAVIPVMIYNLREFNQRGKGF